MMMACIGVPCAFGALIIQGVSPIMVGSTLSRYFVATFSSELELIAEVKQTFMELRGEVLNGRANRVKILEEWAFEDDI